MGDPSLSSVCLDRLSLRLSPLISSLVTSAAINGNLAWFTADIPKSNTSTNQSPRANALVRFVQLRSALEGALCGPPATPTAWCDAKCAREQYESAASVRIGKWGDLMLGMERYMVDA